MIFEQERRKALALLVKWLVAFWSASSWSLKWAAAKDKQQFQEATMKLRPPKIDGTVSVESAIKQRRTIRSFSPEILELNQLSQLLWSAQGVTENSGFKRAAPSAGALYPMDVYAVVGRSSVEQIEAGVYHYEPNGHALSYITKKDMRDRIAKASLSQMWMAHAPLNIVITAEYSRITVKYKERGIRYAMIEAGHIAQNLFLQAEALGLMASIVGAFNDNELIEILKVPRTHEPLLIMPIGYAA
ncbi:MAG: SagB/ThcOx family dehydrogenase [Desulfobacterales bacterium]